MAILIALDSFSWSTKAAAEGAFKAILRDSGYGAYDRITNPVHELMLTELLDRHPDAAEKIGSGVDFFFIGKTSDGDKFNVSADAIGIWIKRTDGSAVDFSYLTAIRSHTPKSDAKEGLRLAVDDFRMAYRADRFKDGAPVPSDLSGQPIANRDNAHVVYHGPTWGQLTYRFADSQGGWNKIAVHSGKGAVKIGSALVDPGVKARWIAFHNQHANLGVATASENAQRKRARDDAWTP